MRLEDPSDCEIPTSACFFDIIPNATFNLLLHLIDICNRSAIGKYLGIRVHVKAEEPVQKYSNNHGFADNLAHFNAVSWRCLVQTQKEVLVSPVGGDVLEHADGVEEGHATAVDHHNVERSEDLGVADFN